MRRLYQKATADKGFTLVEVIISIGFLCIACVIIIQLFIASEDLRAKAALKETAVLKASNAIEACMISDSPFDVGKGIFNEAFTDYDKNENGYTIREYFGENWEEPQKGQSPVYVVVVDMSMVRQHQNILSGFGKLARSDDSIISALYDIRVTAGYVDTGRDDSTLAEFSSAKHYFFREDGE